MKVLQVIPSVSERSGGPGQAIVPMCRALQEQGIEVLLAATDDGLEIQDKHPGTTNYKGVPAVFFQSQLGGSFKYSRPLAIWLESNVKKFDVVHIHAVFNHSCIAAANACRRHGVPYIVRPLGTLDPWSMKQKPRRKAVFWRLAGKALLTGASAVHYTTQTEQEAAEESLGLNHGRVVPLGVEANFFEHATASNSFAPLHSVLAGHPYVLVLSRLHPKKGLDVLLEAFLLLQRRPDFTNWRLVLAGEGPSAYADRLKSISAATADQVVLFPGWLDTAARLSALRQAALVALPSYHENFGLSVVEALACGIPVVVSPHVNLAPEIEAAGAGWVSRVEKGSLENTLAKALGSEGEREKRGRAAKNFARQFSWAVVTRALTKLYADVKIAGRETGA